MVALVFFARASGERVELSHSQKSQIIDAVWKDFHDLFYDPTFRGVDWGEVHREYLNRVDDARTRPQLADLVRRMVATLHNSHSGFMTDEEYRWTKNVLPFFFDPVEGRVFVSYVFRPRQQELTVPIRFGDEILSVDDHPATQMRLPTVFWVEPVMNNPYYGSAKSVAILRVRRGRAVLNFKVPRIHRFGDVEPVEFRKLDHRTAYLRFLKMDRTAISPEALKRVLEQAMDSAALIIDVRHCVGGDAPIVGMVGGMLLGPNVELQKTVRREQSPLDKNVPSERTSDFGAVYKGKVILLTDGNTESSPEILAAALKEFGRAYLVGQTTRGAFNGYMEGLDLPFDFGILVIPIDRSVSPRGKEYEGIGVGPDLASRNSAADFERGRDAVIDAARRSLSIY
jgi:C-terminal processing protease CtpA/Prc